MQVIINQTELEVAITEYIGKRLQIKEGSSITIEIRNTRGADGTTASIEIADSPEQAEDIKELEKTRATKVKEERLEKASTFLAETSATAKQNTKTEEEEPPFDSEEEASTTIEETSNVVKDEAEKEEVIKPKRTSIFNKADRA